MTAVQRSVFGGLLCLGGVHLVASLLAPAASERLILFINELQATSLALADTSRPEAELCLWTQLRDSSSWVVLSSVELLPERMHAHDIVFVCLFACLPFQAEVPVPWSEVGLGLLSLGPWVPGD